MLQSRGQTPFSRTTFQLAPPCEKKGSDPIELAERVLLLTRFVRMALNWADTASRSGLGSEPFFFGGFTNV